MTRIEGLGPTGGPATQEERMEELLRRTVALIENCQITSGVCGCGSDMEDHSLYDGHQPTDYGQYVAIQLHKDILEALDGL